MSSGFLRANVRTKPCTVPTEMAATIATLTVDNARLTAENVRLTREIAEMRAMQTMVDALAERRQIADRRQGVDRRAEVRAEVES